MGNVDHDPGEKSAQHTRRANCGKKCRGGLVNFLAAIFGAVCCANLAAGQIPDVPGWELFWHDEFHGTTLDNVKWEALNRKDSYNNEKQYYHPNQVTVADGNLQLTAINVPRDGKAHQSGLITSRAIYGPGRFEARIDLPTSQGMWPAFWLNANQVQWPLGGEIDIMENRGSQPNLTSSAYHWQTNPGPCCSQHQYVAQEYSANQGGNPVNFHAGFHTYTAEWDETILRFYVDENLYFTVTENINRLIYETQKNIILNLAVGGDFGGGPDGSTVWPQTMYVDYVRIWHRQTGLAGDYDGDGDADGADFLSWQRGDSPSPLSLSDLADWKANFGIEPRLLAATSIAVPESATGVLLIMAATGWFFERVRTPRKFLNS